MQYVSVLYGGASAWDVTEWMQSNEGSKGTCIHVYRAVSDIELKCTVVQSIAV